MGRPPGRAYSHILTVRVSTDLLKKIEKWRKRQSDNPSQGESLCRLIRQHCGRRARTDTDDLFRDQLSLWQHSSRKGARQGTQISDHAVSDGTYFLALIFGRMCERVLDQAADCLRE